MILRRIGAFGLVGLLATLTYALCALLFERLGMGAVAASFLAYLAGMALSYSGHRRLTFASSRPHAEAIPRFIAVNMFGLGVSLALPWLLTVRLGLPSIVAVMAASILVPMASYIGHSRLVFADARRDRRPRRP